jgi:hypothetical protein
MTDWTSIFTSLSDEELDKLAVLRVIETSNGCIQNLFRNEDPNALSVDETREAMQFSMGSIKRMQIVLDNETIDFADDTKKIMADVRDLYVKGQKRGDDVAFAEFLRASHACLTACGVQRLIDAKSKLYDNCYALPAHTWDWGLDYCLSFLREGLFT